jgi:hypothetical protein
MNSDHEAQAPNEGERKLTLKLVDAHAPGLVSFLQNLPARTEAAFIRGLIYQWLLANRDQEDFEQRLMAVLDGPGGRTITTTFAAQAQRPSPALRPRRPRPPPAPARPSLPPAVPAAQSEAAQIVMPGHVPARHQVSSPELIAPPPGEAPSPVVRAASSPAPVLTPVATPPLPAQTAPSPPAVAAEEPTNPVGVLDDEALAALDGLGELF